MAEPRIVPRAEHSISRRSVDPDALKVLYRLRQFDHVAYLVGGSVRDLLLGRVPKDFDIGTSAHPYQVKKLFRNCWIIGRRFRLAHVRFGSKVIEVATFRRQLQPGEEIVQDGVPAPDPATIEGHHLLHHDNTFGTPEEDAFRRDFTINGLFYDIATFSIIDYVGGLDDLRDGVVRSIGDPDVRFREDPVRMLRAIALASRLDFALDGPVVDAIQRHRREIARSSPARLLEEFYKILRSGYAEPTFRVLADAGLLEPVAGELHRGAGEALWQSLSSVDAFRRHANPSSLTNPVLLGSLLVPLGISLRHSQRKEREARSETRAREADRSRGVDQVVETPVPERLRLLGPRIGDLPLARRDVERLRQILALQRRLRDTSPSSRAQRALAHRSIFPEAMTWLEVHGQTSDVVDYWKAVFAERGAEEAHQPEALVENDARPFRRRRRRRRYRPVT